MDADQLRMVMDMVEAARGGAAWVLTIWVVTKFAEFGLVAWFIWAVVRLVHRLIDEAVK